MSFFYGPYFFIRILFFSFFHLPMFSFLSIICLLAIPTSDGFCWAVRTRSEIWINMIADPIQALWGVGWSDLMHRDDRLPAHFVVLCLIGRPRSLLLLLLFQQYFSACSRIIIVLLGSDWIWLEFVKWGPQLNQIIELMNNHLHYKWIEGEIIWISFRIGVINPFSLPHPPFSFVLTSNPLGS